MAKNIVVCCDGTNNQFSGCHTNVIRTYKSIACSDDQVAFYDPGVGTMPEPWVRTRIGRVFSNLSGLAFGTGFSQNIQDAYQFLMEVYVPGDRVFLFGFSRGAYTVRALAGLLHSVGLLRPGSENLIPYAMRYWRNDRESDPAGQALCRDFKKTLSRPCPIHFMGVWDTVGSVGLINHFKTFPHTYYNPEVDHMRHAVSIDERRKCFRQNLMAPAFDDQDILNVWFAGVHSDVGGGYPPEQAGLAKIAFKWIVDEAIKAGLVVDSAAYLRELETTGAAPNPLADQHESLKGLWWLVELIPVRRYSFADHKLHWHWAIAQRRPVLDDEHKDFVAMHRSVIDRMRGRPDYRPSNLPSTPDELEEKMRVID